MKPLLLLVLLMSATSFAQDLYIPGNPYDLADDPVKNRKAFHREKWFFEQRMYPLNFIPADAYAKAIQQRDRMRNEKGFSMQGVFDSWVSLGPTTGFYFNYSNISSRMTSVKYDPSDPNIIYAGAAYGGLWRSVNGGNTWSPMSDNEVSLSCGSIAVDPTDTDIIYFGTGEATYSGASYYGRGLLKSTDGGNTWKNLAGYFMNNSYCSRIAIRPGNPAQLLAAMGVDGLYRSINAGETWTRLATGRCDDVVFTPTGDSAYAIGSGTGYLISVNGGASFFSSAALSPGTRNHIAVSRSSPSIMYAAVYSSNVAVYKSTNSGATFSQIAASQNFNGGQAWYDFYVHVSPFDPNYAYVGTVDIYRTTNGGTNFTNITNGYGGGNVHVDQHNIDFHPSDPNQMLCVNDGGIWKSTNRGTNWTNLNTNQTLTQFYRIASDPSNPSHILGGTQDNGTQRTTGALNWAAAYGGDGGDVVFHAVNNAYILGETQNNGVFRSTNGGASFSSATSGLSGSASWVSPLLSHPDSAGIFYTARQSVFKSTNWGASWFSISTGTSGTVREMAISRSSPNVMFATSGSSVFISTNRGYTFANVTSGLPAKTITSVSIHPDSASTVVLTFSGFGTQKVYKTTNSGVSWFSIHGNLPDSPVNDAVIYYPGISTPTVFVASDVGVYVSNTYGNNWVEVANGLPNTVAMHLDFHRASNKLRIGTHGRGVYEIQLSSFAPNDVASVDAGPAGIVTFPDASYQSSGTVRNNGLSSAGFTVTRRIVEAGITNTVSIAALGAGKDSLISFPSWNFNHGTTYTIIDSVYITGDVNNSNDVTKIQVTPFLGSIEIKLNEALTSSSFPPAGWSLTTFAGSSAWLRSGLSSFGKGKGSAYFPNYSAVAGSKQSLVSPVLPATVNGDSLEFDWAYAPRNNGGTDSVILEASTNAGASYFTVESYWGNYSGGNMNTSGTISTEFFPLVHQWSKKKLALASGVNRIRFTAVSGNGNNFYLDSIRIANKKIHLLSDIVCAPEGYLNNSTQMNSSDSLKVYLAQTASPFDLVDSAVAVTDSVNYSARLEFRNVPAGNFYIIAKFRNGLETWSKAGGEQLKLAGINSYNFTSSQAQAYGSNQTVSLTGVTSIYSGDVNNDDAIDGTDLLQIANDASLFYSGYFLSDVDGNGFVDATDLLIAENNAFNFVSIIRP
ncbi:MAG: hypothetical protein K1X85_09905 [Ignavibacteria bacterium]|nr:hypothetical protein [Ignavibacteria bacterium]